jgi:molybdopterin-synthase adenylyltransferase
MSERTSRQSFLGPNADRIIQSATVGIVGLGGGGSHIVQQLTHVGFQNYMLYDGDVIEDSNLNRLIGGTVEDVRAKRQKIKIAMQLIKGLQPDALIKAIPSRWQDDPLSLRSCDIVFGCVDGFAERRELEVTTRRYLIPLIDIGMDVQASVAGQPPRMGGQVILSMPTDLCMTCMGFLNDQTLAKEAALYGAAGSRPQVVWPNGVLASTAVGIAVDLLTDWSHSLRGSLYLSYDGNKNTMQSHVRMQYLNGVDCPHFPRDDMGDVTFKPL